MSLVFLLAAASFGATGQHAVIHDASDGDPVNLSTGLYWRSDDDLSVTGTPSIVLTRTYRTRDDQTRRFGIGATHSYDLYLIGDGETFQWAELILADGGRIRFQRVSPGKTLFGATFEHTSSPTEFFGSRLSWNGNGGISISATAAALCSAPARLVVRTSVVCLVDATRMGMGPFWTTTLEAI